MPYPQIPQMPTPAPVPAAGSSFLAGMGMKLIVVAVIVAIGSTGFIAYNQGWVGSGTPSIWLGGSSESNSIEGLIKEETINFDASSAKGWALVEDTIYRKLYSTSDGGKTWEKVLLDYPLDNLKDIDFINEKEGWVLGLLRYDLDNDNWKETYTTGLFYTPDGGKTWELKYNGNGPISSIDFVNELVGCTSQGSCTVNGGSDLNISHATYIIVIKMLDEKRAYVTGNANNDAFYMRYTTDGGDTWIVTAIENDDSEWAIEQEFLIQDIDFVDKNNGWISVTGDAHYLFARTTDGGKTWKKLQLPNDAIPLKMDFVDKNNGYVAGKYKEMASVFYTNNGGKTWEVVLSVGQQRYVALDFINKKQGWVGIGPKIYYTANSGLTWDDYVIDNQIHGDDVWAIDFVGDQEQGSED